MFDPAKRNLISDLYRFIAVPVSRPFDFRTAFWLTASLLFSIVLASVALRQAFSSQYVLQDDARQHVFWMARFVDPDLFHGDPIADYFQAIAPDGYALLYRAMAGIGIDPFLLAKLLPMALGLITTAFCFGVSMRILPVPAAGFIGSVLLNQSLWMRNGIVSSTPRAFISPLFLAFMYFCLRRSIPLALVTLGLLALFFPSTMFIALGVLCLQLLRWKRGRPSLSRERRDYLFCAAGAAVALLALLPYALRTAELGPVFTGVEARALPEFLPGGRIVVFRQNFWQYWISGSHTGMFSSALFSPITICAGLFLPALMFFPNRFPVIRRLSDGVKLLSEIVAASLVLFFLSNAILFRLYLPSRYTVNSFRILLALSAGISAVVILDKVFRWAEENMATPMRSAIAFASVGLLAAVLLFPFVAGAVVDTRYKTGAVPGLYEFLERQPKDTLIASLANEGENLTVFTRRPIFVGRETALPYHKRYYAEMRQRAIDLITAQYSQDEKELQNFIRTYDIDYLLVDRDAFTAEYLAGDKWIQQYQPSANDAIARLRQGVTPALARLAEQCAAFETNELLLIPAECILKLPGKETRSQAFGR